MLFSRELATQDIPRDQQRAGEDIGVTTSLLKAHVLRRGEMSRLCTRSR